LLSYYKEYDKVYRHYFYMPEPEPKQSVVNNVIDQGQGRGCAFASTDNTLDSC